MGHNPGCQVFSTCKQRVTACSAGDCPGGLGGAVYLLIHSFVRACLFINVRSLMLSIGVFRDVIENCSSMLDYTGALDRTV